MKLPYRFVFSVVLLWALVPQGLVTAHAQAKPSERSRQKIQAEQERAELRKKLEALKSDIAKTEKAHGNAADALANSEASISNANRALRDLALEQERTRQKLDRLSKSQQLLEQNVARQRARLETLLRGQYMAGQDDRVRLLLSGDSPSRIARELRYLGYISAEQVKAIEQLQAELTQIASNKAEVEETRADLNEIEAEQREQKALLVKENNRRKVLVGQLSTRLSAQRKQAGSLARDEERLASLVDRLTVLIAQQRKNEEEEARRRRSSAEARARQAPRSEESAKAGAAPSKPAARKPAPEPDNLPPAPDGAAFADLRGKGKLPVKGELIAAFGSRRTDGPAWKGVFIKATEGSEVRAAGAGEVVFADWMRGFGNLLIVDHGGQYMSIYGNNQAVLKRPGDRVKAGDVVATVGNSGGNEQSGLYFEMRHQGRAFDPLTWMNR
jgi:septal ring factor EnvC (AmiA/AmiB activator)